MKLSESPQSVLDIRGHPSAVNTFPRMHPVAMAGHRCLYARANSARTYLPGGDPAGWVSGCNMVRRGGGGALLEGAGDESPGDGPPAGHDGSHDGHKIHVTGGNHYATG